MTSLTVGFLTYNDQKYLPYFLDCLSKQTIIDDIEIFCLDNNPENSCRKIIEASQSKFPHPIKFIQSKENLGFAPAHNLLMNLAGSRYYACLNNDTVFNENVFENLLAKIQADQNISSVSPKLLYWDFERNRKTNTIDSTGIERTIYSSFYERGQTQNDLGQFDKSTNIWGGSGAFVVYDIEKLKTVAVAHDEMLKEKYSEMLIDLPSDITSRKYLEYFDDSFFIYKEDVDLAWRLNCAGFEATLVPEVIVWHDRTLKQGKANYVVHVLNRKSDRSTNNRRLSLRNHIKMLRKNLKFSDGPTYYFAAISHEIAKFAYNLVFDWEVLGEYKALFK